MALLVAKMCCASGNGIFEAVPNKTRSMLNCEDFLITEGQRIPQLSKLDFVTSLPLVVYQKQL